MPDDKKYTDHTACTTLIFIDKTDSQVIDWTIIPEIESDWELEFEDIAEPTLTQDGIATIA